MPPDAVQKYHLLRLLVLRELFVSGARGISIHKKQRQLCKIRCLMGDEQMENMRVLKLYWDFKLEGGNLS